MTVRSLSGRMGVFPWGDFYGIWWLALQWGLFAHFAGFCGYPLVYLHIGGKRHDAAY